MGAAQPIRQRESLSLVAIPLALFIVGATTLTVLEGWSTVVKVTGYVLAATVLIMGLRGRFLVAPEVIIYAVWVGWALTSMLNVLYPIGFWEVWFTTLQISMLIVVVTISVTNRKMLSAVMISLMVGVFISVGYGLGTGQFARATASVTEVVGSRAAGLARNPNGFSWLLILAVTAMAYFWMLPGAGRG